MDALRPQLKKSGIEATVRTSPGPASSDPRGWARRICERHQRGERLNRTVLRMAQQAIGAAS